MINVSIISSYYIITINVLVNYYFNILQLLIMICLNFACQNYYYWIKL